MEPLTRTVVLAAQSEQRIVSDKFEPFSVCRNKHDHQLVHGGSTWNSAVTRAQVRDGAAILTFLMPVFVDLMMDDTGKDWGKPFYQVVA